MIRIGHAEDHVYVVSQLLVSESEVPRGGSSPLFAHPLSVGISRFDWLGVYSAPPSP